MADVVDSQKKDQAALMVNFKGLVAKVNQQMKKQLESPLTITLGDEFQGILASLEAAVEAIVLMEETIVREGWDFKLRYVVVEGLIETPINKEIAYGMLGDGLTRARKYLTDLKSTDSRFFLWLVDSGKKTALNNVFTALQDLVDDWPVRDFYLVAAFLRLGNYRKVAEELRKEPSLMWKRRKSLKINAYLALKETVNYIAHV